MVLTIDSDIASISAVEGKNWRHGDIEDVLKTIACIKHQKWTSIMMKRRFSTVRPGIGADISDRHLLWVYTTISTPRTL